jgi:hypothetical protein
VSALDDALHPVEGRDPAQPPEALGAAVFGAGFVDYPTEGAPPFINRRLSIPEWERYVAAYAFPWRLPARLVLHHTYIPDEQTWAGLGTMRAMQRYYAGKGWTSSPHVYAAADGIWLAAPMSRIGIHAGAGNGSVREGWYSIGLEVVWNGDRSLFRGPTWDNALAVLRGLQARIGQPFASILAFHRDYSTKTCPGQHVTRAWVLDELAAPTEAPMPPTRVIGTRPSVTLPQFRAWLAVRHAPLGEHFDAITERVYTLCAWLDIDPAFVAAIWAHETSQTPGHIGTSDLYRKSNNAGAIRAYGRWPSVPHNGGAFNSYESPQLGLFGLALHLKEFYGRRGLLTVEDVIAGYAPASDGGNKPAAYIAAVKRSMAEMQSL